MATIKEIFESSETGTLTLEQFEEKASNLSAKFVDLSGGEYVSKMKYDSDIESKDSQINTLKTTIKDRDKDLNTLQEQLQDAGKEDAEKLSTMTADLTALQEKYDNDTKEFQKQLNQQAYKFAVKEYAATKNFTSTAAKRDFERSLEEAALKLDKNGKIMGADDFTASYTEENSDAFVVEQPKEDPVQDQNLQQQQLPVFSGNTGGEPLKPGGESFGFSFIPQGADK